MSVPPKEAETKRPEPDGPVIPGSTLHFLLQRVARSVAQRLLREQDPGPKGRSAGQSSRPEPPTTSSHDRP